MDDTTPIIIHAEPDQHVLLTKASKILNKNRSTFILDAACQEAENVLLNQHLFQLGDEAFAAFETAMNAPVPDNAKLKALLTTPSPWDNHKPVG